MRSFNPAADKNVPGKNSPFFPVFTGIFIKISLIQKFCIVKMTQQEYTSQ